MEREVTSVSKDELTINYIAEIVEDIKISWIFIHENVYKHLLQIEGAKPSGGDTVNHNKTTCITYESTSDNPKVVVFCEVPEPNGWGKITFIAMNDTVFGACPVDPKEIFFLKLEE